MAQPPEDHRDIFANMADDFHIYNEVIDLDRLLHSMDHSANFASTMKSRYLSFFEDEETLSEHCYRLRIEARRKEMLQTRTHLRFLEYLHAYQTHVYTKEIDRLAHLEGALHCLKLSDTLSAEFATILEHAFTEFGLHEIAGEVRLEAARWRRNCLTKAYIDGIAERPWLRSYLHEYLWAKPKSTFLMEQTEADGIEEPVAQSDTVDCAVCQLPLKDDPDYEREMPDIPLIDILPDPSLYVCATCFQPSHAFCTIKWASINHYDSGCQLCRGPLEMPLLMKAVGQEIDRLNIWAGIIFTVLGKPLDLGIDDAEED